MSEIMSRDPVSGPYKTYTHMMHDYVNLKTGWYELGLVHKTVLISDHCSYVSPPGDQSSFSQRISMVTYLVL